MGNYLHSIAKLLAVLGAIFLLSACANYVVKDHAGICFTEESSTLRVTVKNPNGTPDSVRFFRLFADINNQDAPIAKDTFWVRVTGFNVGRKTFSNRDQQWSNGMLGASMLYSSELAYVQKDDGSSVRASPTIYLPDSKNSEIPGKAMTTLVVDINADELQRREKRPMAMYSSVYIKFDTPPPSPSAHWTIFLGRISLENQLIEIPAQTLCFHKGFKLRKWGGLV